MAAPTRDKVNFDLLIDGAFVGATDDRRLDRVDPFTLESTGSIPDASDADVDRAVASARRAFEGGWQHTPGIVRARLLLRLADLLDANADEIGRLETLDNGKPIAETVPQIRFAASIYRFYAGYADKLYGRQIPMDRPDRLDYTIREPVGVVALVTAWNSPMQLLANKLAPALAAGNAAVVKPSEHAAASTLAFGRLLMEAGLPPGVVNIVSGGPSTGARLTSSPGCDHISFTGSVPTGRLIAEAAARNLVPTTMELGGKSPNIVFADAPLDRAVAGALVGIFSAAGQTCIAGSRLLVQRDVYEPVVEALAARAAQIRLGDPLEPRTQMGPVANRPQFERVRSMVDSGLGQGATLVAGRDPLTGPLERGLFVRPSIFADVRPDMDIAQREIFGPVLSVIPFGDEDEAVAIANGTEFGLASAVWTENLGRAHRMARRLVAGTVWVNTYRESAAAAPFGGTRQSGYGRERGEEALHDFLRTKNVLVNFSTQLDDPFAPVTDRHAILGPGAVGGLLGGLLARAGHDVTVVCRSPAARPPTLEVQSRVFGNFAAPVRVTARLEVPVDVLWVTCRAPDVASALRLVPDPGQVGVVVPVINGIDHVDSVRAWSLDRPVVAAALRGAVRRVHFGQIRHHGWHLFAAGMAGPASDADLRPTTPVQVAADRAPDEARRVVAAITGLGIACQRWPERQVLWQKVVTIAPWSLAAAATGNDADGIRRDPAVRGHLVSCLYESMAVAQALGVGLDPDYFVSALDRTPGPTRFPMERDLAAGRPLELANVVDPILREGQAHGVAVVSTATLRERVLARVAAG